MAMAGGISEHMLTSWSSFVKKPSAPVSSSTASFIPSYEPLQAEIQTSLCIHVDLSV